jgi:FMN phosphatase YigB (HAD superfamily)
MEIHRSPGVTRTDRGDCVTPTDSHLADEARAFTFDCYGTLIDWDAGIEAALRPAGILHIAASRHHDIDPASRLGVPCVWVNRRGATAPLAAGASLTVPSLAVLSEALALRPG